MRARYYSPELKRFVNADIVAGDISNAITLNRYAYANGNPVSNIDPFGLSADNGRGSEVGEDAIDGWKLLFGALETIGGVGEMIAGAALGATVGWTGFGAVVAGFLCVNGAATSTQGIGQIVNALAGKQVLREDNIIKTGVENLGGAIGGEKGADIAGGVYSAITIAANLYALRVGLQQAGRVPVRVKTDKLLNNPADDFVTLGPAQGKVAEYCRTIPTNGYGKIYVIKCAEGYYQIADGHHRVQALRSLGEETVKVFITK